MSLFDRFRKKAQAEKPLTKVEGGLSPIMPPADLPQRSPKAHGTFAGALALFAFRQIEPAIAQMREALALVREIRHRRAEVRMLYDLGIFQQAAGRHAEAVETYGEALAIAREIREELGAELRELAAQAEQWAGRTDARVTGIPEHEWHMEMMILRALSVAYGEMGRTKDAETSLAQALEVLRESPRVR